MADYNCIVVLGPTASGKTRLACRLAAELDGEIISADSRQVYKHLTIGTGKDLDEYLVNGKKIPYHAIDLVEPTEQFYLHQFIGELEKAFTDIRARKKLPVICGGSGLYLDTLRKDFSLTQIKENSELRERLEPMTKDELLALLKEYPDTFTKQVDQHSKKRIIRGIEIAEYFSQHVMPPQKEMPPYQPYYIGIDVTPGERKELISVRLKSRLGGLIQEVTELLEMGIDHQRLQHLGLEYKFVSLYLQQKITKEELHSQLQTAIFQFAKRQMTWFRKMEKENVVIHWVPKNIPLNELLEKLKEKL